MNQDRILEGSLKIWKESRLAHTETGATPGDHLSEEMLYRMARPGGIEKSSDDEVDHLSLCPACLERWASWRRAIRAVEELEKGNGEEEEASALIACGLREAAASLASQEPISMRSSCGRFILGLLPRVDNPDKGLVTIEAAADGAMSVEGRHFTVRDRNGRVVLEGRLHHGRLARTCEKLTGLDLSAWTLVVDDKAE